MTELQKLLAALKKRRDNNIKSSRFGYGVTTASEYAKHALLCAGDDNCSLVLPDSFKSTIGESLKELDAKPVYCNDEMLIAKDELVTNSSDF